MPPKEHQRRFPSPWTATRVAGGWRVQDANGQDIAYVYGRDDQGASGSMMTVEEARRIAVNIARLPDLLRDRPPRKSDA